MNTLVITDWGKSFKWHLPQIDKSLLKGKLDIFNIPSDRNKINFLEKLKLYLLLFKKVKKYDVIIFRSHTMPFFVLTILFKFKIMKRPTLLVLAEFAVTKKAKNIKSYLKYFLLNIVLKEMDLICTFTQIYTEYIVKECKLDRKKVFPIPLAVNHKNINNYPKVSYNHDNYLLVLGRTGRDFYTLSEALKGYNDEVIIITSPNSIKNLKFDKNVKIKFDLPLNKLYEYIKNAKLIVIPLYENIVPTGLRMIYYAMERGKPVIITDSSGIREYFAKYEDYNKIKVKAGDANQLRQKIDEFMKNELLLKQISINARKFTEKFNTSEQYINKLYKKILEIYNNRKNNVN